MQIVNRLVSNTSSIILSTWGPAFVILGLIVANKPSVFMFRVLVIFQIILLVSSVWLLYPLALKSGENLKQLALLSAYIRVFFEYIPCLRNEGQMKWEIFNSKLNGVTHGLSIDENASIQTMAIKYAQYRKMKHFNREYLVLGLTAFLMIIVLTLILLKSLFLEFGDTRLRGLFAFASFLLWLFVAYETWQVGNASDVLENMTKKQNEYIQVLCELAYEDKIINENEKIKMCDKLKTESNILGYKFSLMITDVISFFMHKTCKDD